MIKDSFFEIVTINITEPDILVAAIGSVTNVGCKGDKSGSVTMAPTGGTPAYSYSWSTLPTQTTATATGLAQGTYSVTVTDVNSCSDSCISFSNKAVFSSTLTSASSLFCFASLATSLFSFNPKAK